MNQRQLGFIILVFIFITAISTSTFVIFNLDVKQKTVYTQPSMITSKPISFTIEAQEPVETPKENKIIEVSSEYIENEEPEKEVRVVKEVIEKIIEKEKEMIAFIGDYNTVSIYNSNITVNMYPQSGSSWSSFNNYGGGIGDEMFSVYSNQTGTMIAIDMLMTQNFTSSASSSSNPIGHDTEAIMENSQIEVKRRVIVEPYETDYFQIQYTVKNINRAFFRDINYFNDVNELTKARGGVHYFPLTATPVDLDADGDFDLVTGDGTVLYHYKNIGDNTNPEFVIGDEETMWPITKVRLNENPRAQFADIDNDGDFDLFFGTEIRTPTLNTTIDHYENIGNATNPVFADRNNSIVQVINDYNGVLGGPNLVNFQMLDYDNDGDQDIILISSSNSIYFENSGTISNPNFNLISYTFPSVTSTMRPFFIKYGSDDKYDLFDGESFYENTGTIANPIWTQNQDFFLSHLTEWYSMAGAGSPADLNGDGKQDMIITTDDGIYLYTREKTETLKDVRISQFLEQSSSEWYPANITYDLQEDMIKYIPLNESEKDEDSYMYSDKQTIRYGIIKKPDGSPSYYIKDNIVNGSAFNNINVHNGLDSVGSETFWAGIEFGIGDIPLGEERSGTVTFKFSTIESRGNADLSVENIQFIDNNVSFKIMNDGNNSASNFKVLLIEMDEDDFLKTTEETFSSRIKANNYADYSTAFSVGKGNKVMIIVDSDNSIYEMDESNNKAEKIKYRKNVYVKSDVQPTTLNNLFEEYVKSKLEGVNVIDSETGADYVIYVGNNPYNSQTLSDGWGYTEGIIKSGWSKGRSPYNGLVDIFEIGAKKRIMIEGVAIDGIVAALKRANYDSLENNGDFVKNSDADAIEIFEWFRLAANKPYLYDNGTEFYNIVSDALYGKYSEEDKLVKTIGGILLRLKHLGTMKSVELREFEGLLDYPVVLARGLWSNIESWKDFGIELADGGRDTWLAEITGGPYTEVEGYDYTYSQIIDEHVPAVIGGILNYTGSSRLQYVGHSNGARSIIDSLTNHNDGMNVAGKYCTLSSCDQSSIGWEDSSFGANPVETLVTVGVPGAFEGSSLVKTSISLTGQRTIDSLEELGKEHVNIADLMLLGTIDQNYFTLSSAPISFNLWKQYDFWIRNETDIQPGLSLNLDNYLMIRGHGITDNNDFVVTTEDATAIYGNINSVNKSYLKSAGAHTSPIKIASHPDRDVTKDLITKKLNKEDLNEMQMCFNLIDPENKPWWCLV